MQIQNLQEVNLVLEEGYFIEFKVESGIFSFLGMVNDVVVFDKTISQNETVGIFDRDIKFKIKSLKGLANIFIKKNDFYNPINFLDNVSAFNKTTCVIFGDSITAQNRADTAGFLNNSDRGYFTWANAYLGQRLNLVKNAGVGGQTTAQMLARIDDDVLSQAAGYVFVLGGYNDIVNGIAWQNTISNLETIYNRISSYGSSVIAMAIQPSATFNTAARRDAVANINLWIRNYAIKTSGIIFVDTYTPLLDPVNTSGGAITALQIDTIHPSTSGAQRLGKQIFNRLDKLLPVVEIQSSIADIASPTNPYGNMILNPVMGGTSGLLQAGTTGSVADNWNALIASGTGTSVESKVARTDYPNLQWQQSVLTNTTGSSTFYLYKAAQSMASSGLVVGDVVYAQIEIELSAISGLTVDGINSDLIAIGGTGITSAYAMGQAQGLIEGGYFVLRTPNFTIPPSTTGLQLNNELKVTGNGSVTIRHGRAELRKVLN